MTGTAYRKHYHHVMDVNTSEWMIFTMNSGASEVDAHALEKNKQRKRKRTMRKNEYPEEKGKTMINGMNMEWSLRRSKSESAFGIRGSRIFEMTIRRNGMESAVYNRGWEKRIDKDDEETTLCMEYLLDRFGKEKRRKQE